MTMVLPIRSFGLAGGVGVEFPEAFAGVLAAASVADFCAEFSAALCCAVCGVVFAAVAAFLSGALCGFVDAPGALGSALAGGLATSSCASSSCRMASSAVGDEKNLPVIPSKASPLREDSGMPRALVVKLFPV